MLISVSHDTVVSNKHEEQIRHYYANFQHINASWQNHHGDYGLIWWSTHVYLCQQHHKTSYTLFKPIPLILSFSCSNYPPLTTHSGLSRPCLLHCCLHWLAFSRTTMWPVCPSSLLKRLTSQYYQSLSLLLLDMIMVNYRSIWTWKWCTNFYLISPHIFQRGKILTGIEFFMADDPSRSNTSGSAESPTICQCHMSWWCHRTNHGPRCPYHSFSYVLHFAVALWQPPED